MNRLRRVSAALALLVLSPPARAQDAEPAPRRPADHVFILMLDGTRPDALRLAHAPNLHALAARGTQYLQARTSYPSQTRVSFVTLPTGCHPSRHGIVGGGEYRDASWNEVDLGDDDPIAAQSLVGCPTFFEEATAAGLTSAYVAMKGYELVGARGATATLNGKKLVEPALYQTRYETAVHGSTALAVSHKIELSRQLLKQALELVREKKPNLLILNLASVDYAGHSFGPSSPQYRQVLEAVDGLVGQLVVEVERLGLRDRTAFVVSADHGFSDINSDRLVAGGGRDASVAALRDKGIEHAVSNTGGSSMGLYIRDKKRLRETVAVLRAQPWCEAIYCEDPRVCDRSLTSLNALAPGRSPDLMVDLDDDSSNGRLQRGAHGSLRPNDMRIPLIFSGAGVAVGRVEGAAHLVDVAPTVLRLLGIAPKTMKPDGKALEEVLAK
jgi:predicted AlkP superfamily pyrophosphatase or phosphodiesterase